MDIEHWNDPNIVIWLCFGVLVTVLTLGVRGYSGKINVIEAAFYGLVIFILSALDGAALGQTMYDKTVKYDVRGDIGTMLGLSGPLIVSGLILIVFYRFRLVKHPEELVIRRNDLEIERSYLLGGITSFMTYGLLSAGIGMGNVVDDLIGDRKGLIAFCMFMPLVVAIWLMVKYRKWMFRYLVWVLKRKGLLQVIDDKKPKEKALGESSK